MTKKEKLKKLQVEIENLKQEIHVDEEEQKILEIIKSVKECDTSSYKTWLLSPRVAKDIKEAAHSDNDEIDNGIIHVWKSTFYFEWGDDFNIFDDDLLIDAKRNIIKYKDE